MRVLGIDPGSRCGYAWTDTGVPVAAQSGVWNLAPRRFEGGGMRFLRLRRYLEEVRPEVIFFEEVRRHLGTDAAHIYGGLVAIITAYGDENQIPYQGIPVRVVKKRATGMGNAAKEGVLTAARLSFGGSVTNTDQADALWVLQCGLDELGVRD